MIDLLKDESIVQARQRFEATIVDASPKLPAREGGAVLAAALELTRFRTVKVRATRVLAEVRSPAGKKALITAASGRDEVVACIAALALLRYNSYAGVNELVKR